MTDCVTITKMAKRITGAILSAFAMLITFSSMAYAQSEGTIAPVKGDTTFMFVATILVVLMIIPGLSLFYGGMVRSKNMLSIMLQVMSVFCACSIAWILVGYSLALTDGGPLNAVVGGLDRAFLAGVTIDSVSPTFTDAVIPEYIFIAFQMTFASITPALIVGAMAERAKFFPTLIFCTLWMLVVYTPIAHMVWYGDGAIIYDLGALDFAGGLVVHMNAGVAGLLVALFLGQRVGYGKENITPHSLTLTMVGAALLWVGWFGFNAGSNLEADGLAALALVNTVAATAGATLAWLLIEFYLRGHGSALGAASGAIAGLVAITPAAGSAGPVGAVALGVVASVICYYFVTTVKARLRYDDSLDCFGIHGVGGIVGALGTAIVHAPFLGGQGGSDYSWVSQLGIQAQSVVIALAWVVVGTIVVFFVVRSLFGFRVDTEKEREGLDLVEHGERAYN